MSKKILSPVFILILVSTLMFIPKPELARAGDLNQSGIFQESTQTQWPDRIPTFVEPDGTEFSDGSSPTIFTPASPKDLAYAMGIKAGDLISADLKGSDTKGVGIGTSKLGASFPTEGNTFLILSSGLAASADDANTTGSLSYKLAGINNSQGNDLTQLALQLKVPANMNCASFDFAYYSEEFPEFVGSMFNDAFTAEYGGTKLSIVNDHIVAPWNFAFDTMGNLISVNTVFGVTANTGTTYDGGTTLLRAHKAVIPGSKITIVFSIQDLGDSIYDSSVFLDKFFWSNVSNCTGSALQDTDNDGLLDDWEINGLNVLVNGSNVFVDLAAMGADPNKKDIFVEVDYMVDNGSCWPIIGCKEGHSHFPKPGSLSQIVTSYLNSPVDGKGINLHVDYGPDSVMDPVTGATWGSLSQSNSLPHDQLLGSKSIWTGNYNWNEFSNIKKNNFSDARASVFHYVVFAHDLGGFGSTSGISRDLPASDFIVSLGSARDGGTPNEQAGTFMHELGHNLGLCHGGEADAPGYVQCGTNYKPNYLSIMNYSFQLKGLRINGQDGHFDYSRFALPALNENSLDETVGLNGGTYSTGYGTQYFCGVGNSKTVDQVNDPIDWNCDGDSTDTGLQSNINEGTTNSHDTQMTTLNSHNDWAHLVFTGGAIGQPGAVVDLPEETAAIDLTMEEAKLLPAAYNVYLATKGSTIAVAGDTVNQVITVSNAGTNSDTYSVSAISSLGWADISGVPVTISLAPGLSLDIPVAIHVPPTADPFETDVLGFSVVSQANPLIGDVTSIETSVIGPKVMDIQRVDADPTSASRVNYTVTFFVPVTGVTASSFRITTTGGVFYPGIASVTGSDYTYNVEVKTGFGSGTIRLDVVDDDSITDTNLVPLGGYGSGNGDFIDDEVYVVTKVPTFADVPNSHQYFGDVEMLYANGLTGGCTTSPLNYCPDQIMNRGQAAVFMLRGNFGSDYIPPVPTHIFKDDWTKGKWAEPWAEGMKLEGLSAGCLVNPLKYCPWDQIPREQAVIFALRMKYGKDYKPPAATGTLFADMTNTSYFATSWAEQAYKDGLVPSCGMSGGKPKFCPKDLVSRGLGAYMIVRAKSLTAP